MCEDTPDQSLTDFGCPMAELIRKTGTSPWILSISQAAAMLAFNVVLRAAVL